MLENYCCVPNAIKIVYLEFHTPDDGTLEEGSLNGALTTRRKIVLTFLFVALILGLNIIGYEVVDFVV